MYGHLDMYIQGSPVEIQTNSLESDRPQRDSPSEKLGPLLENVNFFSITENLRTSGSVRSWEPPFITINGSISS
jgi:hypothetical protein